MLPEIVELILKRRRKLYEVLKAKKAVKPEGYFIVKMHDNISEIMIPGVEEFITTPKMKDQLHGYITTKWESYIKKHPMELMAVVLLTDCKMLMSKFKKGDPIKEPELSPCQDPNSVDTLVFSVRTAEEARAYHYPYKWESNRLKFMDDIEDIEMDLRSRLAKLWPINY